MSEVKKEIGSEKICPNIVVSDHLIGYWVS